MQIMVWPHVFIKVIIYQSYLSYEDWQEIIMFVEIHLKTMD